MLQGICRNFQVYKWKWFRCSISSSFLLLADMDGHTAWPQAIPGTPKPHLRHLPHQLECNMLVCIRLYNISCSGALNHNVFFYLDSIWSTRGFFFFLTYFKHLIDVSPPGDLPPSSLPSSQYELSCLGISRALYPSFYLAPYPWYPAFLCYIPVPRASLVRVFFMPLSECSGGPA